VSPIHPISLKLSELSESDWEPRPEYGVSVHIAYQSADGLRAVAAWREKGVFEFTFPFNEFFVIVQGRLTATIKNGDAPTYTAGDAVYFEQGTSVLFDISEDFINLTFVSSDSPISL
jgi:uncharacterized cupin superfamily protein